MVNYNVFHGNCLVSKQSKIKKKYATDPRNVKIMAISYRVLSGIS